MDEKLKELQRAIVFAHQKAEGVKEDGSFSWSVDAFLASLTASGFKVVPVEQHEWLDKLHAQLIAVVNIPDAAERSRAEKLLAEFRVWLTAYGEK